jgi:hypothetical protein
MKTKWIYFYDNVTNDTIVVYFYRYIYTTHVDGVNLELSNFPKN